ncbi:hypothetical protein V3C99_014673 [Haemonchus contortus]|uniref:Movement protein n=1 Tax=Haemonchus contortus TaxID=6289 RepID=A0A7I4YVP5_HAECO
MYVLLGSETSTVRPDSYNSSPPTPRNGLSSTDLQVMSLGAVVVLMIVAVFGISILNYCGRLRMTQRLGDRRQKAVYYVSSLPPSYSETSRPVRQRT